MFATKKISGDRMETHSAFLCLFFWMVFFFLCTTCYCQKKPEPDACVFLFNQVKFCLLLQETKKNRHKKIELIYFLEELLDDLFTFPKERDLCDFQNFLNEKHFPLEKKEQQSELEYISLDQALAYIFALKKKTC